MRRMTSGMMVIVAVLVAGQLLLGAGPLLAAENKVIHWRLAMTWPTHFPILGEAVEKMAADVKRMSGGELVIRIDSANKHKAPFGVLDMVKGGQYQMGGWFRKEVNSLDDLQGLKMRIPGFAGEVISRLGVVVTNIPAGELYTALDRGTIDALEWVGPSLDLNMGFHKVAPYYYTGWHEPASENQFLVNQKAFDALPEHLQAILVNAMELAAYDMYAHITHQSAVNWAKIRKDYPDVKIRTFPKEVIARLKAENTRLLDELATKNPLFKEILTSQRAYMGPMREWIRISDYAYLKDNIAE